MDHVARRKPPRTGRDSVPDLDRPERHRLVLDLVTAGPSDRAGHARAHPQVVVRGVRDRIDLELRDVAVDDVQLQHAANIVGA